MLIHILIAAVSHSESNKCKIQEKQIAIEGFLNRLENEGVL